MISIQLPNTRQHDLAQYTSHSEVVFRMVFHKIFDVWHHVSYGPAPAKTQIDYRLGHTQLISSFPWTGA
jgi:hypothetical protein